MAKTVRMADIAEKLGISIVSVSKGLSGKAGVSEEVRQKILETAKALGYEPPAPKAEEKPAYSENIGILVADHFFDDNTFYSSLYRSVLTSCAAAGFSAMMELVSPQAEQNCIMPTLLTNRKVDALIFMGTINRRYLCTAIQSGLPFILLDFYDEEIGADSVLSDNNGGGAVLTQHLLQTGRTKIGFVGSVNATSSIMDRYLGYVRTLLHAGIEPRPDWRIADRGPDGKFIKLELPQEMPEAFVCNCDEVAFNLVEQLKRAGYQVPRDIAVTGFDDFQFSTLCRPPLTTYRVDVEGMAAAAVEMLKAKLEKRKLMSPAAIMPGAFVRREST